METKDYLSLAAMVIGPIAAVWISIYIQERRERKNRMFSIFLTLISTRHSIVTEEQVRAFNSIDVLFHGSPEVRRHWREYLELLNQPDRQVEWQVKRLELLKSMAKKLGYKESIDTLDLFRAYSPKAFQDELEKKTQIISELLRVLKTAETITVGLEPIANSNGVQAAPGNRTET